MDKVLRLYNAAGMRIGLIHADHKFKPIMDEVKDEMDMDMNYANPGDHVSQAERNNQVIKERIHGSFHRLPYRAIPKVMLHKLALREGSNLNHFPVKGGTSPYFSPNTIMGLDALDYKKHFAIPFGAYV